MIWKEVLFRARITLYIMKTASRNRIFQKYHKSSVFSKRLKDTIQSIISNKNIMLFHVHQYDILMNHKNKSNYYSLIPQLFHKHPNHSSYYTLINTIITHIINSTLINKYKYNNTSFLVKRERNPKNGSNRPTFYLFLIFPSIVQSLENFQKTHLFEPHSVSYSFKDYFIIFYFYIFVLVLKYSSICDSAFLPYFFLY